MAVAAVVAAVTLTSCASFDAALGKRLAIVHFDSGVSQRTMLKARSACSHVPDAKPIPIPSGLDKPMRIYQVQFLVTNASATDIAKLETCLQQQKGVSGIELDNPGEEGG